MLSALAMFSIGVALVCAIGIAVDVARRPPYMAVMALVWPLTALYGGPIAVFLYYRLGPSSGHAHRHAHPGDGDSSIPSSILKSTLHCGAGCTLGDLLAESLLFVVPAAATLLGWHSLWRDEIFSAWIFDFLFAFGLGILFQYFAIKPMHADMSPASALAKALQADSLSLISWQIGMYAVMALAHFWIFPHLLHARLEAGSLVFWWVMQLAMIAGFFTSYPVNRVLLTRGIKEAM